MGKRERAYFNQLNKSSKDKIYVKIFEILVKDSTISFEGLSHALNLKGGKRRLSVELNYLYYHLLRSLHVYRLNTSSPLNTLFRELQFAKILIEKKLLDLALKSIKSIKKKAYRYEAYDVIIHAIVLEEEICFFSYESNLNKSISLLSEERKECIKLIEECNQLQLIKTIILDLQYNEGLYINEDNPKITCLTSPILYSSLSNSVTIEELKLLSKSVGFLLLGKYEKSRTFMLERIELIKNNLHLFSNRKRVTSINNFLFLCTLSTSVKDFTWKWDELLNCFNHLNVGEAHLFYLKYYLPLRMYCVVNDREKLKEILNELGNEPTSKFDLLSETECNELYHNVVWANILTGDIDTAFDYINKWLIIADAHLN